MCRHSCFMIPFWCYLWLPPAETLDRSQKVPWVKPYVWALKDGWFGWLATNRHGRCCVIWREKFGRWPNGITWSNLKLWRTNPWISQPSGLLRKLQGKEQELAQHLHQELSEVWSWSKISGVNVLLGAFFVLQKWKDDVYRVGQGMHNSWSFTKTVELLM